MATILTKKKDTTGAPSAGDLTNSSGGAELAVNTADKRLYTKDSGGNVVEVGINPTSITTGTLNTSGAVVFNDAGADVDFRVEGDTDANLLFVDAGNDRVGIGTNAPDALLNVDGIASFGAGSASTPSIAAAGDLNTGIFFPAADTIAFAEGGAEAMRIDSSGRLIIASSAAETTISGSAPVFQVTGSGFNSIGSFTRRENNANGPAFCFAKSRNTSANSYTVVQNGDSLGAIIFIGDDGTDLDTYGAVISAQVDGTPGANDMPGRLTFSTTADGASSPTERMRIDSSGTITYTQTTLASYRWTSWNPSDVSGTLTNAPGTGTADDSNYVTMANASGTLTITFDVAGKYLICVQSNTTHANTYTVDRLITNFGGTATRRTNQDSPANSGDSANDMNFAIANCFYVSATASQTLTILPTYELNGAGATTAHVAYCSVTIQYCGG